MFWTRLLSSVILTAVTIALVIMGDLPLILALGIISIIGLMELFRAMGFHRTGLAYLCYIIAAIYEVMIYFTGLIVLSIGVIMLMFSILTLYVLTFPKYDAKQVMGAVFGLFYVVFMLSFVFLTRITEGGEYLVWIIFIAAWGSDTLAYCTGMLIGKHKMTPILSPKKSIEGFIGGVIGAGLLGFIYTLIFKEQLSAVLPHPYAAVIITCVVCGALSVIGDLAASAIKRNYDIKDYGTLIPGHGGILDRFDSIIIAAPMAFIMIMFFFGTTTT